jgi:hypothetical protein
VTHNFELPLAVGRDRLERPVWRVSPLGESDRLGIESVSQLREFSFPPSEKHLGLPVRGVIMIDQSDQLGDLKTQGHEFLVLWVHRIL